MNARTNVVDKRLPARMLVSPVKMPSQDDIERLVETGEAWHRDSWTSRYAAALRDIGVVDA